MKLRTTITVAAILSGMLATSATSEPPRAPLRDPDHEFELRILTWKERRERNVVMQKHEYSCGAAAMATILQYYWGDRVSEEDVLRNLMQLLTPAEVRDRVKNGLAISDLRRTAVKMGYQSSIGTLSFAALSQSRVPLLVPLKLNKYDHFVVYRGMVDGRVYLADPIRGNVRPTYQEFCSQWQKNAILVIAKPDVEPPKTSRLGIRADEVFVGDMTKQMIRRQLPSPATSLPPMAP